MAEITPVPEGFNTVTPSLAVRDCAKALPFYERAFGAKILDRADGPDGSIWHATLQIGDSRIMIADEFPEQGSTAPPTVGGTPVGLWLYVEDVDAWFDRAVSAGATVTMKPDDMFWGDRVCGLLDPYGHKWSIASRVEILSEEEMQRRSEEMRKQWEAMKS